MKKTLMIMIACMATAALLSVNTSVASEKEMARRLLHLQGEVTAINPGQHAIVVFGMSGDRKGYIIPVTVTPSTKIFKNGKEATLDDISQGDIVKLVYDRTEDLYATEIRDVQR